MSELSLKLQSLGVPTEQAKLLQGHIADAEQYVYLVDPGMEASYVWLKESLGNSVDPITAEALYGIAAWNKPDPHVAYTEAGYDSCQSHRKLSKVVGEALLIGGLMYESSLLGVPSNVAEAQSLVGSELDIAPAQGKALIAAAQQHGSKQDFLFPGVTPSTSAVPSLGSLAYRTLTGSPETSVRTLTGVGGLRHDHGWNYAMDLPDFVGEKMVEDKRYYPGMGIFYLFMKQGIDAFPAVASLKQTRPDVYAAVHDLVSAMHNVGHETFNGVSVLCSAYLPFWSELKTMQGFTVDEHLELAESFHSPSYEFASLKDLFMQLAAGEPIDQGTKLQLYTLKQKLGHAWSFNSTIHLPWTAETAGLSNDYIGRVTNAAGDYSVRYGIGYEGKSLEVREYSFGLNRTATAHLAGTHAYEVRLYTGSDHFDGDYETFVLHHGHPLWHEIEKSGFIKAALHYLQGAKHG